MLYVSGLNQFFEEEVIVSLELDYDRIELKEIGGTYFLIEEYKSVVKEVYNIDDLRIALDIFNKKCDEITMKAKVKYAI